MAIPRISFSWKPTISGRERWRWGLFMVVSSKSGRRDKLRIMVRGLLVWLGALALLAYLAAASALFAWLERRPYNLVTWTDCVLAPVRWDEIQRKRGDSYIAAGLAALEDMNWSDAVLKLQAGLAKSPDSRRGRERLAYFYIASGQRERGLKLIIEGMERGFPGRETVETFLKLCVAGEDHALALQGIEACLAQSGGAVERERPWLVEQKVRLLMVAQRYEQALTEIARHETLSDLLHESRAVALIELQRYDEARQALAEWAAGSGGVNGGTLRIGVRLAREAGDLEEMRALLQRMRERSPTDPTPLVYAVVQEYLAGNAARAEEHLNTFFMRFETQPAAVRRLAAPLIEIEAWALFDRVAARVRLLGQESVSWRRLKVQADLRRGAYDDALAELEQLPAADTGTATDERQKFWRELQTALAQHLAQQEGAAGEQLLQVVRRAPVALPTLKSMAEANEMAGNTATALELLEMARLRYPGSLEVEREAARLRQLVDEAERPEIEVPLVQDGTPIDLEVVAALEGDAPEAGNARLLGSARLFLERCDALIQEQAWGDLEILMRDLRRARPRWMDGNTNELLVREIELNVGLRNWPALLTNVRFRLDGTLPRALEIMNLVRRLDAAGERTAAERVLAEVERRHENFPPARRLREDWAKAAGDKTDGA